MELRHLRYFLTVAEELHIGKAADRLFMAQQPLSQQMAALERNLGVKLFVRASNRITLTPAGQTLRRKALAIVEAVDEATVAVQAAHRGEVGTLSIAYCRSAMENILYRAIPEFKRAYPQVRVHLQSGDPAMIADMLLRKEVDMAMTHVPFQLGGIDIEVLERQPLSLVTSSEFPAVRKKELRPQDLRGVPFVAFARHRFRAMSNAITKWFRSGEVAWEPDHEYEDAYAAINLVRGGLGVMILPATIAEQQPGLRSLQAVPDLPTVELAALWRSGEEMTRSAAAMLQLARRENRASLLAP